MFFVIDRPQLQRMIALVRDDPTAAARGPGGPYMRMEAKGDTLTLTGRQIEATFPATVDEPGVQFLQVTLFRRLLPTFKGEKMLTIQVTSDAVLLGPVRLGLAGSNMVLYLDPAKAPQRCPLEGEPGLELPKQDAQGSLWPDSMDPPVT